MQRMLGYMRKAIQEFDLIQDGDKIAVGVSGGKDSMVLLAGLAQLRRFIGIDYTLAAITLDPMFGGETTDYSPIRACCEEWGIPYIVKQTQIGQIVFDVRDLSLIHIWCGIPLTWRLACLIRAGILTPSKKCGRYGSALRKRAVYLAGRCARNGGGTGAV